MPIHVCFIRALLYRQCNISHTAWNTFLFICIFKGDENGGTLALAVALNMSKEYEGKPTDWMIRLVGSFYAPLQIFNFNLPSYLHYMDGPGILHTSDVIRSNIYHLFGKTNVTMANLMSENLHTSVTMKSSETAELLDINLIPFSFRSYKPPDWMGGAENSQLASLLNETVLDYRLSPMLASEKDLKLMPATYFIAPEFDPLRDESFMFYGHLREIEMSQTSHEYYRSEQHGFLLDHTTNEMASTALSDFVKYFQKVCTYKH